MSEFRILENIAATEALAQEIASRTSSDRLLLLLDGPMGAGKTQFTRAFIQALGGGETSSPSFAIHHSYLTPKASVEHFDLFRLQSEDDLESTGFWDFFRAKKSIVIIEWVDRLRDLQLEAQLPRSWPKISIRFEIPPEGGDRRKVTIA